VTTTPRIFRVILHVADIDAAADFYHRLLATTGLRVSPGRHYIPCGPVLLALFDPSKEEGHPPRPSPDNLYFATDGLDGVFHRAATLNCLSKEEVHGAPAGQITLRPWGERSFYALDPWGNQLCFVDETTLFTGQ
jgi:catechol 2,3-dioxygenase-like lactoylglutathione lyase family enzyme